ncbi:MAG: serine/threonine protein kinase [Eubacterium sp.]|nr:serine/threonine protein kinase [Eubacterium sp.]
MQNIDLHLLQPGRTLHHRYVIDNIIGEGGFGITYRGRDELLKVTVAIKEYYPHGVVVRNSTINDDVTVTSMAQSQTFERGKEKFLQEAQIIAQFGDQDSIVNVADFFEENNTAYIVMEYLSGITLKEYIRQNGLIAPLDMLNLTAPIIEALDRIHRNGLIHRDISPDNIMFLDNKKVKLMDFGAARDYTEFGEKSLSIVLKPGYAPEEQYRTKGNQGPWTDIYALSATIYKCITGITPDESMQRVMEDDIKTPSQLGIQIPPRMEQAIMKGLSVRAADRYQNLTDYTADLYADFEEDSQNTQKNQNTQNINHQNNTRTVNPPGNVKRGKRIYLNYGRITTYKVISILKIVIGAIFTYAAISVTLDYFRPYSGKDAADKFIALTLTALCLWLLLNGIKSILYLRRAESYGELFLAQRENDTLTCSDIGKADKKSAKRVKAELRWLLRKKCIYNCRMERSSSKDPNETVILEGSNIVHEHYVKVTCESCGAVSMLAAGQTARCEYCGSPLIVK